MLKRQYEKRRELAGGISVWAYETRRLITVSLEGVFSRNLERYNSGGRMEGKLCSLENEGGPQQYPPSD